MKRFMLFAYSYGSSSTSFGGMNDFEFSFETIEEFDKLFTNDFNYKICRANSVEIFDFITEEKIRISAPRYGLYITDKQDNSNEYRENMINYINNFININR